MSTASALTLSLSPSASHSVVISPTSRTGEMRPPPSVSDSRLPHLPGTPLGLDACDTRPCMWRSPLTQSSASSGANATIVLIILILCALICGLALYSAISCFRRGGDSRGPSQTGPSDIPEPHQKPVAYRALTLSYSAVLGLVGAECAICLTEFEEGEEIRVLERCRHGFHGACIERWLRSRLSCPNCRSSCFPPMDSSSSSSSPPKEMRLRDHGDGCSQDGGRQQRQAEELAGSSEQP